MDFEWHMKRLKIMTEVPGATDAMKLLEMPY
jgi:hypothetical protein